MRWLVACAALVAALSVPDGARSACAPGTSCSDGDACTVGDVCTLDGSCAGTPRVCDDGDPCFDDRCDPALGCLRTARLGFAAAVCAFERAVPPTACDGQPVPRRIGLLFAKAAARVARAESRTPAGARPLLAKARTLVRSARRLVDRAQRIEIGGISALCAATLRAVLDDAGVRVDRVRGAG